MEEKLLGLILWSQFSMYLIHLKCHISKYRVLSDWLKYVIVLEYVLENNTDSPVH